MAYQYDVFLSYSHKPHQGEWVNKIFLPFFKPYLEEAICIKNAAIFIDTDEIKTGQKWENKIKQALIHSKIMVSILSPAYFNSDWCVKEFAFMDYRQINCSYPNNENFNGLIVPIKLIDGENFSDHVNEIQNKPFNDYYRVGKGFIDSPLHSDFQHELQKWIHDVAHAYNNAPDFNEDWRLPDWINKPWEDLSKYHTKQHKKSPSL